MLQAALGDGYLGRFVGTAEAVASALQELGAMDIDRVQLTELAPGTHAQLAPHLL
jgi:hypothetical protein